jgi:hypothetical protein
MAPRKPAPNVKKKAVATTSRESKAVVPSNILDHLEQQKGSGFENMDTSDLSMPFLSIIQTNSPQLKKKNEKYLADAEEGDIFNTVSGDVFSGEEGVRVIPCAYIKFLNEWVPRDDGGGLVAVHDRSSNILDECTRDKKGRYITEGGNHIIETATYYVLLETEPGVFTRVVLPMTSTQLKKSRRWNTLMRSLIIENPRTGNKFNPPIFSHFYTLRTVDENNDQGDWKGWVITQGDMITDANLLQEAKAFRDLVRGNEVVVDFNKMDGGNAPTAPAHEEEDEDDDL